MRNVFFKAKLFTLFLPVVLLALTPMKVFATYNEFYDLNNIFFYDENDGACDGTSIGIEPVEETKDLKSFVDAYGQMAFNVGKQYGIPYEAILAQGIIESGYGGSGLTQKANNFFGIKAGGSWTGEIISLPTHEVVDKKTITVTADFRKYPTPQAGWDGYGLFITSNHRYATALQYPGDFIQYITEIKKAGYATADDYVNTVGGMAKAVAEYIKSTNKWPPSSEVAITNVPSGADGTIGTSGCSDNNGPSADKIVTTALSFALKEPATNGMSDKADAEPAYIEALNQYNPGANQADCGIFVATVMIASGVDTGYPKSSTITQKGYVRGATSKYKIIDEPARSDLKPGDILIVNNGSDHHTMIYTGNVPYPAVDASQDDRVPSVRSDSSLTYMLGRSDVFAARIIQ